MKIFEVIKKVLSIVAMVALIGFIVVGIKMIIERPSDTKLALYHKMELDYYRVKDDLVDAVDSIIHHYAPTSELHGIVLVEECDEYEIDVRFALAQGLCESHFGTKGLARRTNSVWNIYAYDSVDFDKLHVAGKFEHPDHSVRPYLKLVSKKYLTDTKTEQDLMRNYVNIHGKRYASDVNYEGRLVSRYNEINSPTIDSLMNQYQMLRLRLNR